MSEPLKWNFWPWWDTCEPDVIIEDEHNICIIEANSTPSSSKRPAALHSCGRSGLTAQGGQQMQEKS